MNTVSQAGPPSPPRAESPMTLAPDSAQPAQQDTEHICTLLSILVLPQGKWPQSFLMSGPNPSAAWLPEVLEPPKGPFSSLSHCPPPPAKVHGLHLPTKHISGAPLLHQLGWSWPQNPHHVTSNPSSLQVPQAQPRQRMTQEVCGA